jgi:hypothetical protein
MGSLFAILPNGGTAHLAQKMSTAANEPRPRVF